MTFLLPGRAVYGDVTVNQAAAAGRGIPLPTGRGLGGGSSVNTMTWFQGHPAGFVSVRHSRERCDVFGYWLPSVFRTATRRFRERANDSMGHCQAKGHGNTHLRRLCTLAADAAAVTDTFLGERHRRIASRAAAATTSPPMPSKLRQRLRVIRGEYSRE